MIKFSKKRSIFCVAMLISTLSSADSMAALTRAPSACIYLQGYVDGFNGLVGEFNPPANVKKLKQYQDSQCPDISAALGSIQRTINKLDRLAPSTKLTDDCSKNMNTDFLLKMPIGCSNRSK